MSSTRKVYARQVPWEWQESPWDDEQLKTDKAALYGNRSYGRYVFDEFEQVVKALEEMDWEDVGAACPYSTEQEMLLDYVPPVGETPTLMRRSRRGNSHLRCTTQTMAAMNSGESVWA